MSVGKTEHASLADELEEACLLNLADTKAGEGRAGEGRTREGLLLTEAAFFNSGIGNAISVMRHVLHAKGSKMSTFDTVKAEEILTASPTMIRTTDGRVLLKETEIDRDACIADLEARLAVATHWRGNLVTIIRLRRVVDAAVGWVADDESGDSRSADQGSARLHNAVRAYQAEEKKLAYRPTPIKLCPACDGKRTIGSWDGKGGFAYATCGTCKGEGTLSGPAWGACQHCQKKLSFAYNCCTSCADERGP